VEAAVLETARGGIVKRGLGYDEADVAVVTNITADHLGSDSIDDMDELVHVKALVAEEVRQGGTLVLNADDPLVAALADRPAVRQRSPVIAMFSTQQGEISRGVGPRHGEVLAAHKRAGGLCYEVADGYIVETSAGQPRQLLRVAELPGAFGGRAAHLVANALAAVAACRAAGVSDRDIRQGLASFTPCQANPGRGNMYRAAASPVIVDYGHNEAALAATGDMIVQVWGDQAVAALTLPGDRRDDLVTQTAAAVAARFGKVVVYEDSDKRGRRPGEMTELITDALRSARPGIVCQQASTATGALHQALALADGAPVLFVYERLALAREALAAAGAEEWPDADLTSTEPADVGIAVDRIAPTGADLAGLAGSGLANAGLVIAGLGRDGSADYGPAG
jgi:cyanophycin synthetase